MNKILIMAASALLLSNGSVKANDVTPPGMAGESNNPWVVLDGAGAVMTNPGGIGAVNSDGSIAVTYGMDSGTKYQSISTDTSLANVKGLFAVGDYAVDSNGHILTSQPSSLLCSVASPCAWVSPTALDPLATWSKATYNLSSAYGAAPKYASGSYANIDGTPHVGDLAVKTDGSIAASLSTDCAAAHSCTWVSPGSVDAKAKADSNFSSNMVFVNKSVGGDFSLDSSGSPANQTKTYTGGVAYSNNNGLSTAAGPAGVITADGKGNSSAFTSGGMTVINTAGDSSKVMAGGATFTNATGSTTTISGGDVTNTGDTKTTGKTTTGSLDVSGDSTVGGKQTVTGHSNLNGGATVNNGLSVNGGASINDGLHLGTFGGGAPEIGATLNDYGSSLSSLNAWEQVAKGQIANLQGRMSKVEGAAALAATLQVPTLEAGKKFAFSGDFGGADSTGAFTIGLAARLNETWQLHAGGGSSTNGVMGGRVGFTGQW